MTENESKQACTFGHVPYTSEERMLIDHLLSQKLPPDFISSRSAGGSVGQVKYIQGWLDNVGASANDPKWSTGVTCTVRITLRDGCFREDTGFGLCENMRTKGQALEKARKEAATDALKRAFRLFGNSLGNCINDKDYIRQVANIPVQHKLLSPQDIYQKGSTPSPFTVSDNQQPNSNQGGMKPNTSNNMNSPLGHNGQVQNLPTNGGPPRFTNPPGPFPDQVNAHAGFNSNARSDNGHNEMQQVGDGSNRITGHRSSFPRGGGNSRGNSNGNYRNPNNNYNNQK